MDSGVGESELFLQWGNRKRNRCARTNKDPSSKPLSDRSTRTITATFIHDHHHSRPASTRFFTREDESKASAVRSGPRKSSSSSPENYYTTRGSVVNGAGEDGVGKKKKKNNSGGGNGVKLMSCNNNGGVEINKTGGGGGGHVWPKLYLGLSNKEKEEDFMAMKGCKPPHRPKKRPKGIQRSVLVNKTKTQPSFFIFNFHSLKSINFF
ncbi:unnamed protein product [Rhodiola kirilowii]